MEIVKLAEGVKAPEDADCICIIKLPEGRFGLNASALLQCGDGDEVESISMIGSEAYSSYDDAEAAGLAWAAEHCVDEVFISTMPG